jgi:hypothetical protein
LLYPSHRLQADLGIPRHHPYFQPLYAGDRLNLDSANGVAEPKQTRE